MAIGTPVAIAGASGNYNNNTPTSGADLTSVDAPIGSLIIITPGLHQSSGTISTCKDSAGNTYNVIQSSHSGSAYNALCWAITAVDVPVGASFTCTTSSGGQWNHNGAWAISGCAGGVDVSLTGNTQSSITSLSQSTGPLLVPSEIILAQSTIGSTVTYTEGSGFTNLQGAGAGSNGGIGYKIVSATTSTTWAPSWTPAATDTGWELVSFMASSATATIIGWAAAEY